MVVGWIWGIKRSISIFRLVKSINPVQLYSVKDMHRIWIFWWHMADQGQLKAINVWSYRKVVSIFPVRHHHCDVEGKIYVYHLTRFFLDVFFCIQVHWLCLLCKNHIVYLFLSYLKLSIKNSSVEFYCIVNVPRVSTHSLFICCVEYYFDVLFA